MSVIEGKNYTKNTPKKWVFFNFMLQKKYHVREGQPFIKSVLYKIGKIKLLNRTLRDLIWLLYGQIQHINKIQARQKYKYMHIAYRWKSVAWFTFCNQCLFKMNK